ncbi:MAG: UPF0182 family protein [Caldilineaceae bacterium]|nr:UPF0182 family protein [Caldilineaceae bacterium]
MRNDDPFADLIRSLEENLERSANERQQASQPAGGNQPPRRGTGPETASFSGRRFLWIFLPILLFLFFGRIISFYADWYWYDSLGYTSVFFTRLWSSFGLFATAAIAFWLLVAVNVVIARRLEPRGFANTAFEQIAMALRLRVTSIILFLAAIMALLVGASASGTWETVLLYLNHGDFGFSDPIFQRDISFYVFTLPFWQGLRTWLFVSILLTLIATGTVYGLGWRGWEVRTGALAHLSILGACLLLLIAWQYRLDAYQLLYSQRGAATGASYTDVHAQLPAYNILSLVTAITAILLVVTAYLRRAWRGVVILLVLWFAVSILASNIYPGLVQRFQVSPNELNLERPYIANNIEFTRRAFDLDTIEVFSYDASQELTATNLRAEPQTLRNIRLWDYRPLLQTYNQIQALRQYYEFTDVDIDRYMINGELRQVMLAGRELAPERLNANAQTWVNRKLVYTHGYGVAVSPVAQVTRDGLPEFYLKDLPPTGVITITQPQIYFGEKDNDYVIARTDEPEFDYPSGDRNETTLFTADTGISMSFGARLLFAIQFADLNLILNSDIQSDSQLLWRRSISERLPLLAPFLRYDSDPYLVISDAGQLFWMQDAYTISNRFPYSERLGSLNYIRNSVKVVMNAYDGSVVFYVMDEDEPIIAAYRKIFPALFQSFSAMPADLQDNIRYPNDLFSVQAAVYRTYHMTDPNEFYNKEDVWAWPQEIFNNQLQDMEPYYVLMQLPGSNDLNFIQILPFTPANRENMIAWLAAKNDPDNYGEKIVYEFGKDSLVYGPKQIEARIDQDPIISAQLSLWNQQGRNVIRGNLLVIPIGGNLIYVEPLYLQAANGNIPELTRVILATADRIVMAENLGLALAELFGGEILEDASLAELSIRSGSSSPVAAPPTGGPALDLSSATVNQLILQADAAYEQAQVALRNGDWATYGVQMQLLERTLQQLVQVAGEPAAPAEETSE